MTELEHQVLYNPDNLDLRIKFAKSLQARAEAILVELDPGSVDKRLVGCGEAALRVHAHDLYNKFGRDWISCTDSLSDIVVGYNHGFIESICLDANKDLVYKLKAAVENAPIKNVKIINDSSKHIRNVCYYLAPNCMVLNISSCNLDDESIRFITLFKWRKLEELILDCNKITETGVRHLLDATLRGKFPKLNKVSLAGNPCDPIEYKIYDQGVCIDYEIPQKFSHLHEEFPTVKWLKN